MDWRTANTAVAVAVPFLLDGEYVIPTPGSVTLTVRGNDGTVLSGYANLPQQDPLTPNVLITLPAGVNDIGSNAMETRYLRVDYQAEGQALFYNYTYRLIPFLPLAATPQDVRGELGLDIKALPDSDVDLYEAYFYLKSSMGVLASSFTEAFTRSDVSVIHVNNMVVLQAAILRIPSLQNRVMKSETSHNEVYERNKLDLQRLSDDLSNRLNDETSRFESIVSGITVVATALPIFFVTQPTDVITGA